VKFWKVILAAVVIFGAGIVTGALTKHLQSSQSPAEAKHRPGHAFSSDHQDQKRIQFLARMDQELDLSPEQRQRIEEILQESQERMASLPREEFRRVRQEIKAELTPEQLAYFEEHFKPKHHPRKDPSN
jgi:Spy/CpxP family protein refolding chaperone